MKYADILQLADFKQMERVRRRVDEIVKDPKTAESLKPYYNQVGFFERLEDEVGR